MRRALGVASAVVIVAGVSCAEVRVEDRSRGDGSVASGPGGGANDGAGGGSGGLGSAASTSSAGGGGSGSAAPATACDAIAWSTPSTSVLQASDAPPVVGDLAIARATADEPAEVAFTHVVQDRGWVLGHVACRRLAEHHLGDCVRAAVAVQTDVPPPVGFDARGALPVVVAAEGPGMAQLLEVQPYPDPPRRRTIAADLTGAREMAIGAGGTIAVVHGPESRPALTVVAGTAATPAVRIACVDGEVPIAIEPAGTDFLVAHGDAPACDAGDAPPTAVSVARVDATGARTVLHAIDLGGPVVDVQLAPSSDDGAWLAARREGEDVARLWRVGPDGALGASRELPVAAGRGIALAARGDGVAMLDTGPAVHGDSLARVRFLDAGLATLVTSDDAPVMGRPPHGSPRLHLAADGASFDALWFVTFPDEGTAKLVALGGDCVTR